MLQLTFSTDTVTYMKLILSCINTYESDGKKSTITILLMVWHHYSRRHVSSFTQMGNIFKRERYTCCKSWEQCL